MWNLSSSLPGHYKAITMKIHVTGAGGFLARWIVPLLSRSHEVETSDRESMDVTDAALVRRTLEHSRPDLVCHLAALCGARPSRERPPEFFAANALGTVNLLEACRRAGVPRFLFASSLTVHGAGDEARTESSNYAPRHPYAVSKAAAELAVINYTQDFGLRAITLRPTLVVGEGYKEPHAIGDFVETVLRGDDIVLFGDGGHRRDFVHPEDVAQAFALAVDKLAAANDASYQVYNISTGQPFRMAELAELVIRVTGRGHVVHRPATDQTFSLFTSIDSARAALRFQPRIDVEDIVRRLARFLQRSETK
jgi:nucleoside-diphosphate-sugar epimerase